jgi:hypothetical protein
MTTQTQKSAARRAAAIKAAATRKANREAAAEAARAADRHAVGCGPVGRAEGLPGRPGPRPRGWAYARGPSPPANAWPPGFDLPQDASSGCAPSLPSAAAAP